MDYNKSQKNKIDFALTNREFEEWVRFYEEKSTIHIMFNVSI